ncbi:MAG: glycosyltransferase family 2 protein, partial [Clostridia bacterium]|nr:glycosyltransferase family 2 protein [Clostridia bacterium]
MLRRLLVRLLIVIPAFNEEANIVRVVEELQSVAGRYDYIVVNDGSLDQTAALCRAHGFPLLDLPVNLGLTGAFQAGIRYACDAGYDAVIQLDADGQHDP